MDLFYIRIMFSNVSKHIQHRQQQQKIKRLPYGPSLLLFWFSLVTGYTDWWQMKGGKKTTKKTTICTSPLPSCWFSSMMYSLQIYGKRKTMKSDLTVKPSCISRNYISICLKMTWKSGLNLTEKSQTSCSFSPSFYQNQMRVWTLP